MSTSSTYGGWIGQGPEGTGGSFGFVRFVDWVTIASAALAVIGTGGQLTLDQLRQNTQHALHETPVVDGFAVEHFRTPSENLARIRNVLRPAVSDLATTFGVSRQSVYNWINGEPVAQENAARLKDLAQAVDVLVNEGIVVNAALLKRKFAHGKTLLQVAQAGHSACEAVAQFLQIHRREAVQRERINARFAGRSKSPVSADFDLPAFNDLV